METIGVEIKSVINQHKGPMERMVIVSGRPQMEAADMPVLHIRSAEDVQRLSAIMEDVKRKLDNDE